MNPDARNPNVLIVEGSDDRHSVIGVMRAHISWPEEKVGWPVYIHIGSSVSEILKPAYISTRLKEQLVTRIGFLLDADDNPDGRYLSIKQSAEKIFPNLPKTLPSEGLVAENDEGKRIGVWIMPDNKSKGCLETFLKYLVPYHSEQIWSHATHSVSVAREKGAPFHDTHSEKANLYTWLAWQNEPGQRPGIALAQKILDPAASYAGPFVAWFRKLYEVE